jgi:hypothetical protein
MFLESLSYIKNMVSQLAVDFFVVYLFSKDSKKVYLTLGVSAGTANQGMWTTSDKDRVRVRAAVLRDKCSVLANQGFTLGDDIEFGSDNWRPRSLVALR